MKYLHISNRGSLNRKLLELIGLSTKRAKMGENSTIGNKGSGAKLAAVAGLRLKLSTGITSCDQAGSYFLEFDSDEITVEGVAAHHVHYHYYLSEGPKDEDTKSVRFPSNMVLEAFPDWDKPIGTDDKKCFKMLREHVCNAYDEDKNFEWEVTEGRHFSPAGQTSVYLQHVDEYRRILEETPERYFKFLSKHHPYAVVEGIGEIWPKSDASNTRLFLLGVLADCDKNPTRSSLYDYSLYDKSQLSEERILKSASNYTMGIGNLFAKLDDVDICTTILKGITKGVAKTEERALGHVRGPKFTPEARVAWLKAAHAVFGPRIALPSLSGSEVVNSDVSQMYGYKLLRTGTHEFQMFLKDLGVPNADDIFPKDPEERLELIRFEQLDGPSKSRYHMAWKLFAKHFPERARFPVYFFHPLDDAIRRMLGFAGYGDTIFQEIWIQAKSPTELPSVTSLLITLIHESRHCVTRMHDHQRGFNDAADQEVLNEIMRQVAATIRAHGNPGEPFGDAKPIDPIFGDPSSKKASIVGDAMPDKTAGAGTAVESTVFGEIDIQFDPDPDAILDRINEMIKQDKK